MATLVKKVTLALCGCSLWTAAGCLLSSNAGCVSSGVRAPAAQTSDQQAGLVNLRAEVRAAVAAIDTKIEQVEGDVAAVKVGRDVAVASPTIGSSGANSPVASPQAKVGGNGDSIVAWILATFPFFVFAVLFYPLVWRPIRIRRQRSRAAGAVAEWGRNGT